MKVLGVIPARGGSTRIPRKNVCLIKGNPLVAIAWKEAMRSCARNDCYGYKPNTLLDLVVSTDDIPIALMADRHGIGIIDRKCGADGPMVHVLLEAVGRAKFTVDAVCCLQPTSPFRTKEDIDGCVALLESRPEASSVVSVDESAGKRNGAVYVTRVAMLRDGLVFDDNSLTYPMPHERSLDINTPEDLELVRRMWDERNLAE